jgi:phosphate-selective porin OprO/OprP
MRGGLGKHGRYLLAGASVIGLLAASAPAAKAQTQDLQQIQAQIQEMQAANREMQATIQALQKQVQDAKAQAAAANAAAVNAGGGDLDLKVKWKGAPELSSADEKKFKFRVRGRVETDYNNIDQDTPITFAPDISATALRRARLGVEGVMFYDFKYVFEVDFAGDTTAVKDAYLQYTGLPVYLTLGNFKTYNSLEHLTSANYITFMERAAFIEAFGIDRLIGAGASYSRDQFTLSAGIFGESVSSTPFFSGFPGDENLAFAARGTVAPINREVNGVNQVLHFGASVRQRDVGDDQPFLSYRARAADLFLANRFVNTGNIGDSDFLWALEAAAVWGPLSVQGEYAQLDVDLPGGDLIRRNPPPPGPNPFIGVPDPSYDGWYVDASYFLTGETRPYKDGRFERVKVKNPVTWSKGTGWGAWQIAGRYDVLNLSDTAFNNAGGCRNTSLGVNTLTGAVPASIAECGDQETWLVGVNWYLTDYVKLMFNYTESNFSGYPTTVIPLTVPPVTTFPAGTRVSGFDDATVRGFGMRAHVDW